MLPTESTSLQDTRTNKFIELIISTTKMTVNSEFHNTNMINSTNISCDYNDYYNFDYNNCHYEYDYEEAVYHLPLEKIIPMGIIYGLTLLLGILGNSLVIFSISKFRRMRSITNVFLVSLASADLLLILICVPIKFASYFSYSWTFGEFLCKLWAYMQNFTMICSVMTLTAMSIERFVAIRYPLRARYICTMCHARIVILFVWIMSSLMAVPILFGQVHKEIAGVHRTAYWCWKEWSNSYYEITYELYMLIIMFVIPVCVMVVTYTYISIEIWHVVSKRANMRSGSECQSSIRTVQASEHTSNTTNGSFLGGHSVKPLKHKYADDDSTRKQVILMLLVIVLLFSFCWGPILIDNVLVAFNILDKLHMGHLHVLRMVFSLMAYANSCMNPIVYGFMSKNFRDSFKYALKSCMRKRAFDRTKTTCRSMTLTTRGPDSKSSDEKENGHIQHDGYTLETCKIPIVKNQQQCQEENQLIGDSYC